DRLTSAILEYPSGQATFTCSTQLVPYPRMHILGTTGRGELEIPFQPAPHRRGGDRIPFTRAAGPAVKDPRRRGGEPLGRDDPRRGAAHGRPVHGPGRPVRGGDPARRGGARPPAEGRG